MALARIRAHLVPIPDCLLIDCRVPGSGAADLAAPLVEVRTATLADGSQIALRSETTWTLGGAHRARIDNRYAHRRGTTAGRRAR